MKKPTSDKSCAYRDKDQETTKEIFNDLFEKLYPKLMYFAMQILDEQESEDVVQDVFMDLWKQKETISFDENLKSYLYKVLYHKMMNITARNKVKGKYMSAQKEIYEQKVAFFEANHDNIINKIENEELESQIHSAIEELPLQRRQIFKMSYLQEMKNKEIAEILGLSVRTVESQMYKALKVLRERLGHLRK